MPRLKDYTGDPEREKKEAAREVRRNTRAQNKLREEAALRKKFLISQEQRGSAQHDARAPSILDNVTFTVSSEGDLISVTYKDAEGVTDTLKPGCMSRVWQGTQTHDCASIWPATFETVEFFGASQPASAMCTILTDIHLPPSSLVLLQPFFEEKQKTYL